MTELSREEVRAESVAINRADDDTERVGGNENSMRNLKGNDLSERELDQEDVRA